MVVTGGSEWNATAWVDPDGLWIPTSRVQVYSTAGAGERLPDINTARMNHACGHYIKDDKVVTNI